MAMATRPPKNQPPKRGTGRSKIGRLQVRCLTCPYYKLWWCKVNKTRVESGKSALKKACSFEYSFKKTLSRLQVSNSEFTRLKTEFKKKCTPQQWVEFMVKHGLNQGYNFTNQEGIIRGMQEVIREMPKKASQEEKKVPQDQKEATKSCIRVPENIGGAPSIKCPSAMSLISKVPHITCPSVTSLTCPSLQKRPSTVCPSQVTSIPRRRLRSLRRSI